MNDCTKRLLGSGSYGDVYELIGHDPPAVIKCLRRPNERGLSIYYQECNILKKLTHPNIILLIRIEEDESRNEFGIVMEYCRRGPLEKIINDSSIVYSMKTVIVWAVQLFDALRVMFFEYNVVHRDIKPDNIFVNEYYVLKIGDFGSIKLAINTVNSATFVGTLRYMSPRHVEEGAADETEMLQDLQQASHENDVYSLGLVLWEIIERKLVFSEYGHREFDRETFLYDIYRKKLQKLEPPTCQSFIQTIVERCTNFNRKQRPKADEVLRVLKDIIKRTPENLAFMPQENEDENKKVLPPIGFDWTIELVDADDPEKILPKRPEISLITDNVEEQMLMEPVRVTQAEHEQEKPSTAMRRGRKTVAILVISSLVMIGFLLLLTVLSYFHFTDFFYEKQMVAQEVYNTTLGNETHEETFVAKHEKKSMNREMVLPHVKEPIKEGNSGEVNRREQLSKELSSFIPGNVGDITIRLSEIVTLSFEIRLQDVDRIFTISDKNASILERQVGETSVRVLKHNIDKETAWRMLNNIETCKSLSLEMMHYQSMSQLVSTVKFLQTTFQRQDFLPLLTRVKQLKIQTNILDFLKLLLNNFSKIVERKATFQLEWLPSEVAQYKDTMFTLLKTRQFRDCQIIEWDSENDFSHEVLLGSNALMTIRKSESLEDSLVLVDKLLELGPSVGKLGSLSMIRWVHRDHTENIENAMFTNFEVIHNRLRASTAVSRIVGNREEVALLFELNLLRIQHADEFEPEEFANVELVRKAISRNTELVVMLTGSWAIHKGHNHFRIQIIGKYRDI